jgi:hypothetical protein
VIARRIGNRFFSGFIRSNYTTLQQNGKTNAAIPVNKRSDSMPPWIRARNRDHSYTISTTRSAAQLMCMKNGADHPRGCASGCAAW